MGEIVPTEGAGDSPRDRRKIELTPPPRTDASPRVAPETGRTPGRPGAGGGGLLKWVTVVGFGVLITAAAAVFVVLPEWVEERQSSLPATPVQDTAGVPQPEDSPESSTVEFASAAPPPPPLPQGGEGRGEGGTPPEEPSSPPSPPPSSPPPPPTPKASPPRGSEPALPSEPPRPTPGDDGFVQAMSAGLAALDRQDLAAARTAFVEAKRLRPGAAQAADGLTRAEVGLRRAAIAEHREQAEALEAREDWRGALRRFTAVLELDPTVSFAQEGHRRSLERAELTEALEAHLRSPDRLATDGVLREASALVARAEDVEPAGARHSRQVDELRRLVRAFSTPVPARLRSDSLTQVVVYKVGRLGTFDERTLELRPGTYTVVGQRPGYRDVRRRLVIEPGQAPEPLVVRCEEEI